MGHKDHERTLEITSRPSISGSPRSRRIMSGHLDFISESPSPPVEAVTTL